VGKLTQNKQTFNFSCDFKQILPQRERKKHWNDEIFQTGLVACNPKGILFHHFISLKQLRVIDFLLQSFGSAKCSAPQRVDLISGPLTDCVNWRRSNLAIPPLWIYFVCFSPPDIFASHRLKFHLRLFCERCSFINFCCAPKTRPPIKYK
jgi:hypothetical protein